MRLTDPRDLLNMERPPLVELRPLAWILAIVEAIRAARDVSGPII